MSVECTIPIKKNIEVPLFSIEDFLPSLKAVVSDLPNVKFVVTGRFSYAPECKSSEIDIIVRESNVDAVLTSIREFNKEIYYRIFSNGSSNNASSIRLTLYLRNGMKFDVLGLTDQKFYTVYEGCYVKDGIMFSHPFFSFKAKMEFIRNDVMNLGNNANVQTLKHIDDVENFFIKELERLYNTSSHKEMCNLF